MNFKGLCFYTCQYEMKFNKGRGVMVLYNLSDKFSADTSENTLIGR